MTNNFFKNKIVVITGAGAGLGKALSIELALQKADVIMVGKKKEELLANIKEIEQLKKKTGRTFAVAGDASTKEGCDALFRDIKKVTGTFEILINNSSVFTAGKLEDAKAENIKKVFDTNVFGSIFLTKLAIPVLKSNKKPGIINIGSFAGKVSLPYFSVYAASQFAFNGFAESLQKEYAGEQLRIMNVYTAGIKDESLGEIDQKMEKLGFAYENPTEIAKKIVEAYNENRKDVVFGKKERGLIFWNAVSKKSVDEKFKKIKTKILNAIADFNG
jgi:short-subunit dehydrogenase